MNTNPLSARLQEYVVRLLETEPVAGISLGVTDRDQTLHTGSYGYAELASQTMLRPDHLIQIGSIGKSFTAIVLLQLHEEGILDLKAPVAEYLPWLEIPSPFEPITIHHLLTHTAGIIGGMDESPSQAGEALALKYIQPGGPPGVRYHYSNSGYKVLGLVVEKLTGRMYSDAVRERILEPLGMHDTAGEIRHVDRSRHAVGYFPFPPDRPIVRPFTDNAALQPATWFETATADGCISSTPGDMAIYARALLNRFNGILSEASFVRMTTPHIAIPDSPGFHYGYALNVVEEDGKRKLMHGGGMVGYYCYLLADMDSGIGAAALLNGPGPTYALVQFSVDLFKASRAGEPLLEVPALRDYFLVEEAEGYAGVYRSGGKVRTVRVDGGGLVCDEFGVRLAQRAPDLFFADDPRMDSAFIKFIRNAAEEVVGFEHGPDWFTNDRAEESPGEPPAGWTAFAGRYISYNPWYPGFHVYLRRGKLVLAHFMEGEESLVEIEPGLFRIGEDQGSPERLQFEEVVDGKALVARFSGTAYYRG